MTTDDDGSARSFLLPEILRDLPYSWDFGFVWPPETEESRENLAYARAVLEACLPPAPLAVPEPPPEVDPKFLGQGDDEPWPEWTGVRYVLREHMPYARCVTRERMAEAEEECARRGYDTTDFAGRWTVRISAWIVEQVLHWCGLMVDDIAAVTPWLMQLAERYARRGMAAEQAVWALRNTADVPASREVLSRLAADGALPLDIRELAVLGPD